jgi:hypothetical protein
MTIAPRLEWKSPLAWILGSALAYIAASWMIQDRYYQLMFTLIPIWALVGVA